MGRSKSNQTSLSYLESISTHYQPVQLKGATISFFESKASPFLETFLLSISYIQLLAQAILINPSFKPFPNDDSTSNFLLNNLSFISKVFAPGSYDTDQSTLSVLFICLMFYSIIKVTFAGYIALAVRRDFTPNRILLAIWRMFCKVHDRLLCFTGTSLWLSLAINAHQKNQTPFGISPTLVTILSVTFMSHDIFHSIGMNLRYNVLLPTKDSLQAKTNTEKLCILLQRSLLQILFLFLTPNDLTNAWLVASLNLAFSLFNSLHCYTMYPFYSLKTLAWYSSLLATTTALNISFFLRLVLDAAHQEDNFITFAEVIVYWIILSILLIKGGHGYLMRMMIELVTQKKDVRPEMLIHRISVIKQIRKIQKPSTSYTSNYEWAYLVYNAFKSNIHAVFDINPSESGQLDFDKKEDANRLILLYLENLMEKYPKGCLIRLYAAYYYGKKLKDYTSAMKILLDLQQSPSKQIVWNSLHFLEKMQLAVQAGYKNDNCEIDLAKYIHNVMSMNKLKESIIEQARLQLDILKENNKTKPDIGKIYDNSQKVIISRKKIEQLTSKVLEQFPGYYLEPQLLLAYYHSILNFSSVDLMKYQKMYRNNYERYQKKLEEDALSGSNLYEKETALIVITSETRKTATITYSSKSAQEIFGRDLKGAQAFTIMPAMLQNHYSDVFRVPEENKEFLGKVHRTFILHKEDYLKEVDLYFNIHPFISQGLNYNLLVRPIQEKREHIIISTTGIIEGFSDGIAAKLCLDAAKKANANINQVSKELGRSSEACNAMMNTFARQRTAQSQAVGSRASVENGSNYPQDKDFEKAQNTWNIITTEGRDLMLRPYKDKSQITERKAFSSLWNEPIVYHCKMYIQHYGSKIMKVITIEELLNDYDSEQQDIKVKRKTTGSKSTSKGMERGHSFHNSAEDIVMERGDTKRKDTSRSTNVLLPSTERNNESLESPTRRSQVDTERTQRKSRTFSSGTKIISPKGHQTTIIEEEEEDTHSQAKEEVKVIQVASPLLRKDSKESLKSRSSAQEKVSKAIKEAFNTKFYPRYLQGFRFIFYILFVGVFITQIVLNLNVEKTTTKFGETKSILKEIIVTEKILTNTYIDLLYMIDLASGRLTEDDLGFLAMSVPEFLDGIASKMMDLANVNNEIIKATKTLSPKDRRQLFDLNVKYYDTDFSNPVQTYTELNGFLAIQRIIETSLKGLNLAKTDFPSAMVYLNQVLRNSLNDIIWQINNSVNSFLTFMSTEKEAFERSTRIAFILALIMLAIKTLGSALLIWRQYNTESLIMLAFIKLNKLKINQVSANINTFKQTILNETSLEDAHFNDSIIRANSSKNNAKQAKSSSQKYETVIPNSHGIIRRYLLHFLRLFLLQILILGYVILSFVLPQNSITDLYNKVDQSFWSDSIGINSDVALISSHLALNVNSVQTIALNVPVPYLLEFMTALMQENISAALRIATTTEWNYGEDVTDILYGNGCSYTTADKYAKEICDSFSTGSKQVNIVSLLGYFQGALAERNTKYQNSDQTYESLRDITKETFPDVTLPHTVLHVLAEYISNLIDQRYDEATEAANRDSTLNLCLMCVILFITGSLSWWAVLKPVQETDNKMKNVLQMIPSNMIFSNFILKNYLIKTSNGALNFVKNNI